MDVFVTFRIKSALFHKVPKSCGCVCDPMPPCHTAFCVVAPFTSHTELFTELQPSTKTFCPCWFPGIKGPSCCLPSLTGLQVFTQLTSTYSSKSRLDITLETFSWLSQLKLWSNILLSATYRYLHHSVSILWAWHSLHRFLIISGLEKALKEKVT